MGIKRKYIPITLDDITSDTPDSDVDVDEYTIDDDFVNGLQTGRDLEDFSIESENY